MTAALMAAGLLAPVGSTPALADSQTTLPLSDFADILVDDARSQVFVSGGPGNSSVVVLGFDGSIVTEIPDLPSSAGMVLDGDTLYVARSGGAAIDVVNAATLEKTGSFSLPAATGGFLAMGGGRLWFGGEACGTDAGLASLDPGTGDVQTHGGNHSCPLLVTSPTLPDFLFVGEVGPDPTTIFKYDISSGSPVEVARNSDPDGARNLKEVAVTPDGSGLLLASGYPYWVQELRTSDLERTGFAYVTGWYPWAVDVVAARGGFLAAGVFDNDPDVHVFPLGGRRAKRTYSFLLIDLADRGLAFTSDGTTLFAVTDGAGGGSPVFHVLEDPTLWASTVSLSASAPTITLGETVTLSGTLSIAGGESPEGKTIEILRTLPGGPQTSIGTAPTGLGGAFSFEDTPLELGSVVYEAKWDGDAEHASSSDTITVEVVKRQGSVSVTVSKKRIAFGKRVTVTAHLDQFDETSNKVLEIYQRPKDGGNRLLVSGDVNSRGDLSVTFRPTRHTIFTAEWDGDETYEAALSPAVTVAVKVLVKTILRGHYGKSGKFKLYRLGDVVIQIGKVKPKHDGRLEFVAQKRVRGRWRTVATARFRLRNGVSAAGFRGPSRGDYRFQNVYFGDADHLGNKSRWAYARVT